MALEIQHNFLILKAKKRTSHPPDELPTGYSPYSSATYYNAANAEAIRKILDTLDVETKLKDKVVPVNKYRSVNTVYQQIYQGWRYLIERCDTPELKYANLRAQMSLRRERDRVRIYWNTRSCPTINGIDIHLEGFDIESGATAVLSWKEVLLKWGTDTKDGEIIENKISLTDDEVSWVYNYFASLQDVIVVRANSAGYKVVKNAKLAEAIREERGG